MLQAYKEFWTKMFVFNAKATRLQYWSAVIINFIVVIVYGVLTHQGQYYHNGTYEWHLNTNSTIFTFILILVWIANFTIRARRLHDTDRSNWWILIELIPFIGQVWFFILMLLPSKETTRWTYNQSEI